MADVDEIFRPLDTGRMSEQIVDQFTDGIRSGRFSVGDRLPPERVLVEQLKVSRTTVRDALRILEARGLVEIRVGSGGGAFVTAPLPQHISQAVADMLMLSSLDAGEVTELRMIVELGAIRLACDRANDNDIESLFEVCDRADSAIASNQFDVRYSAEFHLRLARSAHNAALEQMILVFHGPLLASLQLAYASTPSMAKEGVQEHREIVDAIARSDVREATDIMRRHLLRTAKRVAKD